MEEEKVNLDVTKSRFSGAPWFAAGSQDIVIGGVGGIGSWVALSLARIGHSLHIFDGDTVEEHNLGGQCYKTKQIGMAKVQAVKETIAEFCNNEVYTNSWYTEDSLTAPIVFSCFDNMKARKLMFEKWAEQEDREVFIDGRLLAEVGMVYCVQKGQEDLYRSELFDDEEVEDAPCNYKATTFASMGITYLMTNVFNNYLTNKVTGVEATIVQFRTDFAAPMMLMEEVTVELPQAEAVPVTEEVEKLEEAV